MPPNVVYGGQDNREAERKEEQNETVPFTTPILFARRWFLAVNEVVDGILTAAEFDIRRTAQLGHCYHCSAMLR